MALMIGRREGEDLFLGDIRVEVIQISSAKLFTLRVHEDAGAVDYQIDDRKEYPILFEKEVSKTLGKVERPVVHVSARPNGSSHFAIIGIKAPRSIDIVRGELYRQSGGEYRFTDRARAQIEEGLVEASVDSIAAILPRTTVYSHPRANRRFDDLLFKMNGKIVEEVFTLSSSPEVVNVHCIEPLYQNDTGLGFEINCN
jgi:sRNA-binding carbon storage regulator CsrA